MPVNIPETGQKRIVVIGGGFAGLTLARKLARTNYQVVLVDKNNFHQFQPLFYQVAMAGLEPSSIAFPFRKIFQRSKNVFVRVSEVTAVKLEEKRIITTHGYLNYDYLVVAVGADTNFFGNENIARHAVPMKSVSEALYLRNSILEDYETCLTIRDYDERQHYIDIVIVGGGPTGVEIAGALAEMRKYVIPHDYKELDEEEIDIYLVQSGDRLLKGMSQKSADTALQALEKLGVKVILNNRVTDYDGEYVYMKDGSKILTKKLIWAAGIKGNTIPGLPEGCIVRGNRIKVDEYNEVEGVKDVFAIGDIAFMPDETYEYGHPQVAQVAIQQGKNLADNFKRIAKGKERKTFKYKDKGSMATIGRRRAVVDLPNGFFKGTLAWVVWLIVHLFAIIGVKNKLIVFINWVWNYVTYDQSLRLIIRPFQRKK